MTPDGWLDATRRVESPNCDDRPVDTEVSLLIVHSISLPPGEYGGDAIERFFTNRLDAQAHPYFQEIAGMRVSAHFLIRRDGELMQFVPVLKRAWHAGVSSWRGRSACNDFSVGVELEGTDDSAFDEAQYRLLEQLVRRLRLALPLRDIAAHSDVAPGRKTDPGAGFAWTQFLTHLSQA